MYQTFLFHLALRSFTELILYMNMYMIPQSKLNYCFLAVIYLFLTGLKCLLIGGENKQLKNK